MTQIITDGKGFGPRGTSVLTLKHAFVEAKGTKLDAIKYHISEEFQAARKTKHLKVKAYQNWDKLIPIIEGEYAPRYDYPDEPELEIAPAEEIMAEWNLYSQIADKWLSEAKFCTELETKFKVRKDAYVYVHLVKDQYEVGGEIRKYDLPEYNDSEAFAGGYNSQRFNVTLTREEAEHITPETIQAIYAPLYDKVRLSMAQDHTMNIIRERFNDFVKLYKTNGFFTWYYGTYHDPYTFDIVYGPGDKQRIELPMGTIEECKEIEETVDVTYLFEVCKKHDAFDRPKVLTPSQIEEAEEDKKQRKQYKLNKAQMEKDWTALTRALERAYPPRQNP